MILIPWGNIAANLVKYDSSGSNEFVPESMLEIARMPFASYSHFAMVAEEFQIVCIQATFVEPVAGTVRDYLRAELEFNQREFVVNNSENTVCENLIYPVLREVWRDYTSALQLWGHEPLRYDDRLCGTPDYFVAKRSRLGKWIRDVPYLIVVEAKKDDFELGWGQCLAAMVAAQKLNGDLDRTIFGIVTNGLGWQFGKLEAQQFVQDPRQFGLVDLDEVCAAIRFVFEQSKLQVTALTVTT